MKAAVAVGLLLATPAWAGSVTVVNGGGETIRQIVIGPSAGGGDNRLRSTLPPGAQARITYSTGCQAVVRLVYDSGRSEDFAGIDPCTDARVTAGGGATGPAVSAGSSPRPANDLVKSAATGAKPTATAANLPVKAPPPVVPPWTGKSITKRFGGMQ